MNTHLMEHGKLVETKGRNGVFPIRIITEGQGSSGFYSRELLETYKDVFAGRPMFMNHPKDPNKPWERDILGISGRLSPKVEAREVDGVMGLYTEATVRKEYREFVEEFADVIGVSVYIAGDGRQDGDRYIVESLDGDDPYSSVDFVVAAGRGGRVEQMIESYRSIEASVGKPAENDGPATAGRNTEQKDSHNMENAELGAKLDKLAEALAALSGVVTPLLESLKPAEAPEGVKLGDVSEAIVEAKLPAGSRKAVYAAIESGTSLAEAIKAETERVAEIRKELTENAAEPAPVAGRVVESERKPFSLTSIAGK